MQKDNRKKPTEGDSSTQELLRQLRMQYEQERPEDVFEDDATESVIDESDAAENEEITRRIMEMFSAAAQEPEESEAEGEPVKDTLLPLPEDDEDIEVEVDDEEDEDEIDVEQEPAAPQPLPEEDVDVALPLPEDYEGEVSDAALPDFDDELDDGEEIAPVRMESVAPERANEAQLPASESHPEPQEEETQQIEEEIEHAIEPVKQEAAAQDEQADAPSPVAEEAAVQEAEQAMPQDELPDDTDVPTDRVTDAVDTGGEAEPVATPEAALPLSEGEEQPSESSAAEAQPDPLAPELQDTAAPVELAEDELLLDEYDELPATPAAAQDAE